MSYARFVKDVYSFYSVRKRNLPWRRTRDPYKILVSEIMLQQTQVPRVLVKYEEFLKVFPTWHTLARSSNRDVLKVWSGLGYNRRALYLKHAAEIVVAEYGGKLPRDPEKIDALPGIGAATAAAICVYAFNAPLAFIETNVRSVYIHFFFKFKKKVSDEEILPLVKKTLDQKNPRKWYWALMDYGTYLKKVHANPSRRSAHYAKQSKFIGSHRQIRGKVVKILTLVPEVTEKKLARVLNIEYIRIQSAVQDLLKEGLVMKRRNTLSLS